MHHYNTEELKKVLPEFFTEAIDIVDVDVIKANPDENGYTEDTIAFIVQHHSDNMGMLEVLQEEVFIARIGWEEQILECAITIADYEKLRSHQYGNVIKYLNKQVDNIVTSNNGNRCTTL